MNMRREIRGICSVECDEKTAIRLMNICSHRSIQTWCDRRREISGFYIYRSDGETVRMVAERCGLNINMNEVRSFRSFVRNNKKRLSFAVGVLVFVILVYIQSLYIWHIDVSGCGDYTSEEILDFIHVDYPCIGRRKSDIDLGELRDRITGNYSDICWASCDISGTKLTVNLRESVDMFTDVSVEGPSNLVASMDCVIYSIVTSAGTPVVTAGDEVKKGDILISGVVNICNDDSEVVETRCVAAQGQIYGVCKISYRDEVKAVHYVKTPLKDRVSGIALATGSHVTRLYGSWKPGENDDVITQEICPHIGDFYLPVSVNIEKSVLYQLDTETYDEKQLKQLAEEHLMSYIGKMQEKGVQIMQKNVIITNGCDAVTAEGDITVRLPVAVPDVIKDANN